jgi:hypothetical protein
VTRVTNIFKENKMNFQNYKNFQYTERLFLPPHLRVLFDKTVAGAYQEYSGEFGNKFEACAQKEAAAHEAGRCIAMKAMGLKPLSATIERIGNYPRCIPNQPCVSNQVEQIETWFGRTDCAGSLVFDPNGDKRQIRLLAIKTLAGNIAETKFTGRTLPSSSIDQEALATIYVCSLVKATGNDFGDEWANIIDKTEQLLEVNQEVGAAISKQLISRNKIHCNRLTKLLAKVDSSPIAELGQIAVCEYQAEPV